MDLVDLDANIEIDALDAGLLVNFPKLFQTLWTFIMVVLLNLLKYKI